MLLVAAQCLSRSVIQNRCKYRAVSEFCKRLLGIEHQGSFELGPTHWVLLLHLLPFFFKQFQILLLAVFGGGFLRDCDLSRKNKTGGYNHQLHLAYPPRKFSCPFSLFLLIYVQVYVVAIGI